MHDELCLFYERSRPLPRGQDQRGIVMRLCKFCHKLLPYR
jgi:hypothetical protein